MLLLSFLLFSRAVLAVPHWKETSRQLNFNSDLEPASQTISNAPSFVFAGDAPYGATTADLSSILLCPNNQPNASTNTVLLVHGTGSTGYESWAHGYVPALTGLGYTVCYVTLPNRSSGDVQLTSAYVAYNIHLVSSLSGNKPISVIGHSQGGPNIQWALRFFPSTRSITRSYIGLSPDLIGTTYFNSQCNASKGFFGECDAASWQQCSNSNFMHALNYRNSAFVQSTLIWTNADEIVTPPQPNAELKGAESISVQSICPNQSPDHFEQLINPTTYAIAVDALKYGIASPARIPKSSCNGTQAPGMDVDLASVVQSASGDLIEGSLLAGPKLTAEPTVLPYARISNQ